MAKVGLSTKLDQVASLPKYRILDIQPEAAFDRLTQLAASICETPIAAITLIERDKLWFKSVIGLDIQYMTLNEAFCSVCLAEGDAIVIPDTLADARTSELPLARSEPKIRFYAGIPVWDVNGCIWGTLCVADYRPKQLSDRQIASLKILGAEAGEIMELRRQITSLQADSKQRSGSPQALEIEQIYQLAIDAIPQGAILLSRQGVICNSKAEEILGRTREDTRTYLLIEPCWQAVSEDLTPLTIDTHPAWMTLTSGRVFNGITIGIPKADGKLTWVKLDTLPLLGMEAETKDNTTVQAPVHAVLCSLTEIATSETPWGDRDFLSLSSDLLGVFNRDGCLKQVLNTAWETILGYDVSELLSQPSTKFIHSEDRSPTLQELAEVEGSKTVTNFLNRWSCRDGSFKWICWNIIPIPDSDLIYAIGRDMTESRLLQASIQELDNINLALERAAIVAIFDINGSIKHANQKLCELSMFALDELLGKPLSFLDSGQSELLFRQILQTLESGEIWKGEIEFKSQGAKYFWVDLTIVPLSDRQGNFIHYVGIGNDITDKKQLEKQFLHAQRLESIGTMAGGISHDLNNILTPILAASQLLQMKFPEADSRTKQLLKTLEINSKRGASLIKQVLSFARGLEGVKTALTVKHIITEIHQIISQTFPKSLEIVVEIPTDLWMVMGDPTQIHQVLMNLAVNARDAMADGGTLTISAENLILDYEYTRLNLDAKVGPYVSICVMDNGMGIPAEIIDRIFDPFFTTKDLGQGTGLGLATVLTIIKGHNGFIKVDSRVGKGSLFQIYLPAIVNVEDPVTVEPLLPLGKGELILVVDDENLIVETTKTILETYNYRVLIASDGIDAIALYAQRKHDISAVILDLMMPMMDGSQTLRILKRLNPLVKAIATSGLEGNYPPYNINSSDAFLPKPYTPRDLLETLSKILHKT